MKKTIFWLTGSSFFDVDKPIVPILKEHFEIYWIIIKQKESFFSAQDIRHLMEEKKINGEVYEIKNRLRSFSTLHTYRRIIKKMISINTDLYYVNFLGIPYLFPLIYFSSLDKSKIIYPCHDYIDHVEINKRDWIAKNKKFIYKNFQNFQFFSNTQKSLFEKDFKNKKTFYAPLALKGFGEPDNIIKKNNKTIFLFFGTIRKNKGVEYLIEAANLLFEKFPNQFIVKIYGKCNDWHNYNSLIKYEKCFDIQIRPIINEEIPNLFSSSDYLVLPYKDVTQSGPLLISYYYNLPVIASNHDGFKEYIIDKETGFLFKNADYIDLYNKMCYVIENFDKNILIRKNLQKYITANIKIEKIIEMYVNGFNEIISINN